ncbi:caspase family protein [Sorangium sp. So ce1000]|uniref:caspase family protein n=1 Tax=Sorangium sp. So ce1000 TaxID=3133325 RepID=UPI003F64735E
MNDQRSSGAEDTRTSEPRGASPTFRALLIGVDFYCLNKLPNDATYASLRGCVSDVDRIEKALRARITMPLDIRTLLSPNVGGDRPGGPESAWPTYKNMKAALDGLLARTQPGDHVYIHYSGHGGRVLTKFADLKPGGFDETLVPTDIGDGSRYLRDLDVAYYLDALTRDHQATVTVVLDSCHSGGATRGVHVAPRCATGAREGADPTLDTAERPTDGVASDEALRAAWARLEAAGGGRRAATATTWLPEARDYVLLAACRDVETALEVRLAGGGSTGVMTAAFLDALEGLGKDQTWRALYERVLASVHSKYSSQTPQLLGQGERQIFGAELRPVVNAVRVHEIDAPNRRVKLGAGLATGTQAGARFGIYPPGTTDFTQLNQRVGVATVDKTMAVESWASLEEGAAIAPVELGAPALLEDTGSIALRRAVNLFHRDDLPSEIDQDEALGAVGAEIEARGRGFLELVSGGTPHYQIALTRDRRYEIWDPSGKPIPHVGTVAIGAPGAAKVVVERLIHLLRCQSILELADPVSGLKDKLRVELLTPPPGWSESTPASGGTVIEPDGDAYVIKPDTWVFLRVVNESDSPVNVAVIDLGDDWGIRALEPPPPEGLALPTRRYSTVDARREARFAFQFFLPQGRDSSLDVIKVFVTLGDADFWWLLHTSIDTPVTRSLTIRDTAANDALFRLREALDAEQNTLRDVRPRSAPGDAWTTRQLRVETRRA